MNPESGAGSKYEERKQELTLRIKNGDIGVLEARALNHACYFCHEHIDGMMVVLVDHVKQTFCGEQIEVQEFYPLHRQCYLREAFYYN